MVRKPDADLAVLDGVVRHALESSGPWRIERTRAGVSTHVYRLSRGRKTLYLRIAESREASLAPEVLVHGLLRAQGAKVPEVVHFEPLNEVLERSLMVTTEIEGTDVGHCRSGSEIAAVLRAAGRDLAVINSIPVRGFGWIRRDTADVSGLNAEHPSHNAFALANVESDWEVVEPLVGSPLAESIRTLIERYGGTLDVSEARLAHGDFDATAIFQREGRYTGVIDFGDIRGTHPLYDIGHFSLHEGDVLPAPTLPRLLEGYREISPLPDDHELTITLLTLMIGLETLARTRGRRLERYQKFLVSSLRRTLDAAGSI